MAIFALVGLPGAGKSYAAVAQQILPALKAGRCVVTNIPLDVRLVAQLAPQGKLVSIAVEQLATGDLATLVPPGAVAVFDEVWRFWPAKGSTRLSEATKSWFAEHRHRLDDEGRATQIILVVQDLAMVATFIRSLVDQTFVHTKHSALGIHGAYRVGVYAGGHTGLRPQRAFLVNQLHGRYEKKITALYRSHTLTDNVSGVDEKPVDQRGSVWRRPMFLAGGLFCLVGIPLGIGGTYSWMKSGFGMGAPVEEIPPPPAKLEAAPRREPRGPPAPPVRVGSEWRVAGVMEAGRASVAFLTRRGGDMRTVPLRWCGRDALGWRCSVDLEGDSAETARAGFKLDRDNPPAGVLASVVGAPQAKAEPQPGATPTP